MAFYSGHQCDKCSKRYEIHGNSASEVSSIVHLRRQARRNGWTVGKQLLCETCKRGVKTDLAK